MKFTNVAHLHSCPSWKQCQLENEEFGGEREGTRSYFGLFGEPLIKIWARNINQDCMCMKKPNIDKLKEKAGVNVKITRRKQRDEDS